MELGGTARGIAESVAQANTKNGMSLNRTVVVTGMALGALLLTQGIQINARIDDTNIRIERLEDAVDARFDRVDSRIDQMEEKLDLILLALARQGTSPAGHVDPKVK